MWNIGIGATQSSHNCKSSHPMRIKRGFNKEILCELSVVLRLFFSPACCGFAAKAIWTRLVDIGLIFRKTSANQCDIVSVSWILLDFDIGSISGQYRVKASSIAPHWACLQERPRYYLREGRGRVGQWIRTRTVVRTVNKDSSKDSE